MGDSDSTEKAVPSTESPPAKKPFLARLPPALAKLLSKPRTYKTLFRCWLASWATIVITLPHQSLLTLGNTAFFALLTSLFVPPSLPAQMFLFIMLTIVVGICLGWAVGVAAMRAAVSARSQVLLQSTLQKVQESTAGQANPEALYTLQIFAGAFLDWRSSLVFGAFLAAGNFLFALIRSYQPKLIMMSIFATIACDIFCTFGPLFPFPEYTILNSLLTCVGVYLAIALLLTTFVFPESMNHVCMGMIADLLGAVEGMVQVQEEVLHASIEGLQKGSELGRKTEGMKGGVIGLMKGLDGMMGFLELEVSVGRWSGEDVEGLKAGLAGIVARTLGLGSFSKMVLLSGRLVNDGEEEKTDGAAERTPAPISTATSSTTSLPRSSLSNPQTHHSHLLQLLHATSTQLEHEHSLRISDLLPILASCTADLRGAVVGGISAGKRLVESVNHRRWKRGEARRALDEEDRKVLDGAIEELKRRIEEFEKEERIALLVPFQKFFQSSPEKLGTSADRPPLRTLFTTYVFASNLLSISRSLLPFLLSLQTLNSSRPSPHLWFPKGLRALSSFVFSRGRSASGEEDVVGEDPSREGELVDMLDDKPFRRDPDSSPPGNVGQRVMNGLHRVWKWGGSAEALFCVKYVVLTVGLYVPAAVPRSAHFYYVEKGVWALIMAQTTLNVYASDQIFNYVTRLAGTFVGLILGLLAWYVGNGNGFSPYGFAASSGVFVLPLVALRVWAPPQHLTAVIMTAATFALIIGYSNIDGHLVQVASPGIGWSVAWKRWTLVVIGCAASAIIMIIPPKSGRKAVRIRNAHLINGLANTYAFLMGHWISDRKHARVSEEKGAFAAWLVDFRKRLIKMAEEIGALRQMTGMAKWEGSIRGSWPVEEYEKLVDTESDLLVGLALLGSSLGQLDDEWRQGFVHKVKILNPNFMSDVMSSFSVASSALRTTEPVHQVVSHSLIDRAFYHASASRFVPPVPTANGERHAVSADRVDWQEMQSLDYMYFASAIAAEYMILTSLDEIQRIVKRLCGEVPLTGFERWRDEYERSHIQV